ncbi:hypothetical protein BDR26DRAFT_855789 [Obelidium mucronatum]|nr:hypothetical protein BDR26DRAFT_855789 [Obelidium mucronatum]
MAADIPALIPDGSLIPQLFQTTAPLSLDMHSMLDAALAAADDSATTTESTSTSTTAATAATTITTNPSRLLLTATHKINTHLTTVETTTGPLPDAILETALLLPNKPAWLPSEIEALDKGLELYGKNFTRISRDCVQSKTTFECIHAYYTRKHDLRSVKVKKYKKKVGKEDEEYIKYVGGLGKYIAMETKRMKADKLGKVAYMATSSAAANGNGSAAAVPGSNGAGLSSSSAIGDWSSGVSGVVGSGGPIKVGGEIKGLMGSIKDLTESGVGSGVGVYTAVPAGTNNGAVSLANVISDDAGGRGVRTRRSAAS